MNELIRNGNNWWCEEKYNILGLIGRPDNHLTNILSQLENDTRNPPSPECQGWRCDEKERVEKVKTLIEKEINATYYNPDITNDHQDNLNKTAET